MDKVSKTGLPDGCWYWNGALSGSGYGQFWDGERNIPAHWFFLNKRPQKGKEACHKCDNKICVRPSHIFIGTRSDNMKDCVSKGRLRPENGLKAASLKPKKYHKGINNHECKLTNEQAALAKKCPRKRGAATAMSKKFGVSLTVICDIRDGKRWTHLKWTHNAPKHYAAHYGRKGGQNETVLAADFNPSLKLLHSAA